MGVGIERLGPVAWLTIDRPEKRNAVDPRIHETLAAAWPRLERDPAVRVMVLTGAGDKAFSAGADIATFLPYLAKAIGAGLDPLHFCGLTNRQPKKPLIAAINGDAFGGGLELALAADLRIAADHARFALPEVRLGAIAGAGGVTRLRRMIASAVAEQMILTGEAISAARAHQVGLVSEIVPLERLRGRVSEIAASIAAHSEPAIAACRDLRADETMSLDDAMARERATFQMLMQSESLRANLDRFARERSAMFKTRREDSRGGNTP